MSQDPIVNDPVLRSLGGFFGLSKTPTTSPNFALASLQGGKVQNDVDVRDVVNALIAVVEAGAGRLDGYTVTVDATLDAATAAADFITLAGAPGATRTITFPASTRDGSTVVVYNATPTTQTIADIDGSSWNLPAGVLVVLERSGQQLFALAWSDAIRPLGTNSQIMRADGSYGGLGFTSIATGNADVALSTGQAASFQLRFTGALTAGRTMTFPLTAGRNWHVVNDCTGAFVLTIKGATGTGITLASGARALVGTDGTNFYG